MWNEQAGAAGCRELAQDRLGRGNVRAFLLVHSVGTGQPVVDRAVAGHAAGRLRRSCSSCG